MLQLDVWAMGERMFVVIFEVQPKPERRDEYLNIARELKPKLEAIDGFLEVERFQSKRDESRLLSLSSWRDERALVRWRRHGDHRAAQAKGRSEIFADYRLRVGEVTAAETPGAKVATITKLALPADVAARPDQLLTQLGLRESDSVAIDVFESIYNPGKFIVLASWRSAAAAGAWTPNQPAFVSNLHHRQVRIIRDYGMFDRHEAPRAA